MRLMRIRFLSIAILLFLPLTAAAQTVDEVVNKALNARGGLARIKAVHSQRISGTISFGPGTEGPFLVELERPGKMHIEVNIQGQMLIRSYDGKSGWVINPFGENKGVQTMTAEDLSNISDESDFDGPLVDYKQKGSQIELAGKEDVEGKPAYRLKLTTDKKEQRSYYFDAATYRLVKWEGNRKVGEKLVPWESFFRDYREVSGLQFAFEIDSDAPGTDQSQKIVADKIDVDPQFEEARFGKPAAPPAPPATPDQSVSPPPASPDATPPPAPNPPSTENK
jgi:outer membrane lipoprotein-sorting protein